VGKEVRKADAYLRTSSRTNVGADKDSDKRQRAAIEAYAKAAGYEIVETFYDAAVSGADPVDDRPGFTEMLERLLSNGARTILVESPDRFARDLWCSSPATICWRRGSRSLRRRPRRSSSRTPRPPCW
jgi:DNA invertase Pin-like site-specific DNA recombinase